MDLWKCIEYMMKRIDGDVQATEILEAIKRGEDIDCENVTIRNSLKLDELDLMKDEEGKLLIISSIRIRKSIIEGSVNFEKALFQKIVDFEGTSFTIAGFEFAKFSKYAGFEDTTFSGYAAFQHAQFMGEANFSNAQFSNGADAYFYETKFKDNAFFWSISSKNITFSGDAYFRDAEFHKKAEFYQSNFLKKADFTCCWFGGDASFVNAQFEEIADFKGGRFKGETHFTGVQFNKQFDLRESRFTYLKVGWSSIKNQLVYDGPVFLALIRAFKIMEQFDDADDCYYEYRMNNRNCKKWFKKEEISKIKRINWSKFYDYISWISCGYGVCPLNTVFSSFLLILLFGITLWILDFSGYFYKLNLNVLYLSAKIFVLGSLVNLDAPYNYVALVEIFFRGIIFALFVVVLTRKFIR